MKEFEVGDLIIIYHNYYHVAIVTDNSPMINSKGNLVISTKLENSKHIYTQEIDRIKANCGKLTFKKFYKIMDETYPEYAIGIQYSKERVDLTGVIR